MNKLWTLLYTIHVFCLHNYALYPVIRLYCGLIQLEYARFYFFLASFFFIVYVYSLLIFIFLWTFMSEINLDDDDDDIQCANKITPLQVSISFIQ